VENWAEDDEEDEEDEGKGKDDDAIGEEWVKEGVDRKRVRTGCIRARDMAKSVGVWM
jgi:hypothetical protein